jgi:DNA-binding transcriptional MerR regulator
LPRRTPAPVDPDGIPEKPYFKIGEAARLCAVKPYVLRYWETEFARCGPRRRGASSACTAARDVELLLKIRQLLYAQRFTIEGARARLREMGHEEGPPPPVPPPEIDRDALRRIKQGLLDLLRLVED